MSKVFPFIVIFFILLSSPRGQAYILEQSLEEIDYEPAVEALFTAYEQREGKPISPGTTGRAGIKVMTGLGAGLSTPPALTNAVMNALQRRGFSVFIIDQEASRLRAASYLPPLSQRAPALYRDVPVVAFVSEKDFDSLWFYESALPSADEVARLLRGDRFEYAVEPDSRKSFLPTPLLFDCDIWINLPFYIDHPTLGVSGAIANASLWNISNYQRFLDHPTSAPVAATEICAIPELKAKWLFSITSLERFQYIGGPIYNENYVASDPVLWLSPNPVALDYRMYLKINRLRNAEGFPLIVPEPLIFDYASKLGLGNYAPNEVPLEQIGR